MSKRDARIAVVEKRYSNSKDTIRTVVVETKGRDYQFSTEADAIQAIELLEHLAVDAPPETRAESVDIDSPPDQDAVDVEQEPDQAPPPTPVTPATAPLKPSAKSTVTNAKPHVAGRAPLLSM